MNNLTRKPKYPKTQPTPTRIHAKRHVRLQQQQQQQHHNHHFGLVYLLSISTEPNS